MKTLIQININRFKEGARVLEDIARFILKDEVLFLSIKQMKKSVDVYIESFLRVDDIGDERYAERNQRHDILNLFQANIRRMQEAARVLEEVSNDEFFKSLRFQCYRLHEKMSQTLHQYCYLDRLVGIYPIIDPKVMDLAKVISFINNNKINICQLRAPTSSANAICQAATRLKQETDALLIINNRVDIAMLYADGVHIGQDDLSVCAIRSIAPANFIVGVSCHDVFEATDAVGAHANYVSVGCLYPSKTKPDAMRTSLSTLREIRKVVSSPLCAVGGVTADKIPMLHNIGVNLFAMGTGPLLSRLHVDE